MHYVVDSVFVMDIDRSVCASSLFSVLIDDIILNLESQAWGRIFHDFYENIKLSQ